MKRNNKKTLDNVGGFPHVGYLFTTLVYIGNSKDTEVILQDADGGIKIKKSTMERETCELM